MIFIAFFLSIYLLFYFLSSYQIISLNLILSFLAYQIKSNEIKSIKQSIYVICVWMYVGR